MSTLSRRFCLVLALMVAAACGDPPSGLTESDSPLRGTGRVASHAAAPQPMAEVYGPQRFTRTSGSPSAFTVEVSTLRFEAPFTLHVRNGAPDGSGRAVGVEVALDGRILLSQRDFARQATWSLPVALGASASLRVALSGPPGGYIEIWIEGKRSLPVFCPNGPAGSYAMLREAIEAVWVDGTVLVCDGVHSADRVLIDKPLTLRSQNQGGATLADTQPEASYTSRLPALVIDGVSAGLVRIADISFLVKNRGITAEGTFDQVELDSVRMRGARIMNSVGLAVGSSTVPTAKVEVLRSHFEAHALGVWPIRAVETNVRWSTFHGMGGGSVVYSGGFVSGAGSGSFGVTEHNLFTDCSPVGCVRIVGPGEAGRPIRIAHNVMTRNTEVPQSYAILAARSSPGAGVEPGLVTIEHNEVMGTPPVGDPGDTTSWRVRSFLLVAGGARAAPVLVRHNRVTNVHTGIQVLLNTRVAAHDNSFRVGYRAVYQRDASVFVSFTRNDVVGFGSSLWRDIPGGEPGNYRCNWWGSIAGPQNPSPNVLPASYTPWAMQPIANTQTDCDPNAGTATPAWIQLSPTGTPPSARYFHSAVYDVANDRMIVFGGVPVNTNNLTNDTWILANASGANGTPSWTQLTTSGGPPAARGGHSAVYDAGNNRMIMFAGGSNGLMRSDVWVLSNANGLGGTPTWAQLSPGTGPAARTYHTAVYDHSGNRMIIFAGNLNEGNCFIEANDTWVLSNANGLGGTPAWTQLSPTGGPPAIRNLGSAVYHPATNRMTILWGRLECSSLRQDFWTLTNANGTGGTPNWNQLTPTNSPPARAGFSTILDAANQRVTVFGGSFASSHTNEVWVLTSAVDQAGSPAWTQLSPTGTPPSVRAGMPAVYNPMLNRMIVFSGFGGASDVWVLTHANGLP